MGMIDEILEKLFGVVGVGISWILTKAGELIVWVLKEGGSLIVKGAIEIIKHLSGVTEVFIIVGITGMFLVMIGKRELGTKITSGSFVAYVVAKGVSALC